MKYLFFIQSDGRGHLSQALALREKLEKRGHEVVGAVVGVSSDYVLPEFFKEQINAPLFFIASPTFIKDKKNQGVKIFKSALKAVWHLPAYIASLKKIKKIVDKLKPDALINFYEPIAGNYFRFYRKTLPMFCIAHQHFIEHPFSRWPKISRLAKMSFKLYNRLTSPRRAVRIALSFAAAGDQKDKKLFIVPPLIRETIKNQKTNNNDYLLVYLLNHGYSEKIIALSQAHPELKIEAFWDKSTGETAPAGPNLNFHPLSGQKFIDYLANCRAYISTAGFDSVAEAAYLQKEILLVPTKNHFEQKCNAFDAARGGLAVSADDFDENALLKLEKNRKSEAAKDGRKAFKSWVDSHDYKIIDVLEKIKTTDI
ncbi:MAG: glycosyltransferase family protein [Patescibacteria group bacterium]